MDVEKRVRLGGSSYGVCFGECWELTEPVRGDDLMIFASGVFGKTGNLREHRRTVKRAFSKHLGPG
jgi:hypothetical protein